MTPETALDALGRLAVPGQADGMADHHGVERPYLGVANADLDALVRDWRQALSLDERLALAEGLWRTDIHEARIAAAKLLTQARIRTDDTAVWSMIQSWVPDFDGWAIADACCIAAQKRLAADPARLDEVEEWTRNPRPWVRRAALIATLHLARLTHPKPAETAARERVLGWAEACLETPDRFLRRAVAEWLRDLSKHDPDRTRAFLSEHGPRLGSAARREASRHLV